jgi:PiT family inorganic phosphate transporter
MRNLYKIVLGAGFALAVSFYANSLVGLANNGSFLILAAAFGAYMAMNIGANDVANNVGPAVGAGALSIGGAILVASIFELLGALIAGGDVVGTIKKGIIDPAAFGSDTMVFVYAMSAALLSAALWLNLATWLKAPVSTTHSIVGGVMGAGIAAGGFAVVSWVTMGKIAASWVISPVMGGVIAAIFLYIIKSQILYRENKLEAAKKIVPYLVALMTAAFIAYITLKGLKKVWPILVETLPFLPENKKPTLGIAMSLGAIGGIISYFVVKMRIVKKVIGLENTREDINKLFTIPLIFAAALLSFAHGANDVANAIGPLAAVNDALTHAMISTEASIPLWVMIVGGLGISIGLALFGPRLIRTVGSEITELDHVRAFSIMMAASLTVVIASQLGLPVSSTHIAVGAVFGVGFLRELIDKNETQEKQQELHVETEKLRELKADLAACLKYDYKKQVELSNKVKDQKKQVKKIKKKLRNDYVKRDLVKKIVTAWIITVPTAAVLSAIIFYALQGATLA